MSGCEHWWLRMAAQPQIPEEPLPNFRWPFDMIETITDYVVYEWPERASGKIAAEVKKRPAVRSLLWLLGLFAAFYIFLLLVAACYVWFPIPPYGVWDVILWIIMLPVALFGLCMVGASFVFVPVVAAAMIGWFLHLVLAGLLSLGYVSWVVLKVWPDKAAWLYPYRAVITAGVTASVALAAFVEGSYSFGDQSFDAGRWAILSIIALSVWAAFFCYQAQEKVLDPHTPRSILKWTICAVLALGVVVHWHAQSKREEYFLQREVVERSDDPNAWLKLAWYYKYKGDDVANEMGPEDGPPPDPTPWYKVASACFDKAGELGAGGYDFLLARAEVADAIGDHDKAVRYGLDALQANPGKRKASKVERDRKWLREMIARNPAALNQKRAIKRDVKAEREDAVRAARVANLPWIVRWVFRYLGYHVWERS